MVNEATGVRIAGLCTDGGTRGIQAWGDAALALGYLCSTGANGAGLVVHGAATQVSLEEAEILDAGLEGGTGYGIAIQEGASLDMQGGAIWGASTAGVMIDDANQINLSGITVRGTRANADGAYGHGLQVRTDTVQVTVQDVSFMDNQGAGVHVLQGLGPQFLLIPAEASDAKRVRRLFHPPGQRVAAGLQPGRARRDRRA